MGSRLWWRGLSAGPKTTISAITPVATITPVTAISPITTVAAILAWGTVFPGSGFVDD